MDINDFFFCFFSLVLFSIEKIYQAQTGDSVVSHFRTPPRLSKVLRSASYFNSALGGWKCDETLSLVLDTLLKKIIIYLMIVSGAQFLNLLVVY